MLFTRLSLHSIRTVWKHWTGPFWMPSMRIRRKPTLWTLGWLWEWFYASSSPQQRNTDHRVDIICWKNCEGALVQKLLIRHICAWFKFHHSHVGSFEKWRWTNDVWQNFNFQEVSSFVLIPSRTQIFVFLTSCSLALSTKSGSLSKFHLIRRSAFGFS